MNELGELGLKMPGSESEVKLIYASCSILLLFYNDRFLWLICNGKSLTGDL
jgi:hypothetical protein